MWLSQIVVLLSLALSQVHAQQDTWVFPTSIASAQQGVVQIQSPNGVAQYVAGVGWVEGQALPAPIVTEGGEVRLPSRIIETLSLPYVREVREGTNGSTTRLVLEFANLQDATVLVEPREGILGGSNPWRFPLGDVGISPGPLLVGDRFEIGLVQAVNSSKPFLVVQGEGVYVRAFSLREPDRLVLDIAPESSADRNPSSSESAGPNPTPNPAPSPAPTLATGVRYEQLEVLTTRGSTTVHVMTLDPTYVSFDVIPAREGGATVSALAQGAVAAINAGYFDPTSFAPIGLRLIGGEVQSSPSRGRSVVGFADRDVVMGRAGAGVTVLVNGNATFSTSITTSGTLSWSTFEGRPVGSARVGVLTLDAQGRVLSNGVGPRDVPRNGMAISYAPSIRELALIDPGDIVKLDAALEPASLQFVSSAVEAGPLLVADGKAAFAPELEAFARGERILDEATQQSAIGVRRDGKVLFVVAESMTAEELIPVFLSLGAREAMRLDSGSSATLVAGGQTLNRVVSRRVESAIVAYPRTTVEVP